MTTSDAERLRKLVEMSDEQVDYSDIPELDDTFWKTARGCPTRRAIQEADLDQD